MALGFIKALFGSKTKRRLSEIIERLKHPTYQEYKDQAGYFQHLKEAEKYLAIERKRAEIAMPNIMRAWVNKDRMLNLQAKFSPYAKQRDVLSNAAGLATNQQWFLEDLKKPLTRISINLDQAMNIFLLKDDPEIRELAAKISEAIKVIDEYDEQLSEQCSEIDICMRKRSQFKSRGKNPKLWKERDKVEKLKRLIDDILKDGIEKLEEKIKDLTSAENVARKFRDKVVEIAGVMQAVMATIDKGEYLYYQEAPLSISNFPEKTSNGFELQLVAIRRDRYQDLELLVRQLVVKSHELSDLRDSFMILMARSRFSDGVKNTDIKGLHEDITALIEQIRKLEVGVELIIKRKQFKDIT